MSRLLITSPLWAASRLLMVRALARSLPAGAEIASLYSAGAMRSSVSPVRSPIRMQQIIAAPVNRADVDGQQIARFEWLQRNASAAAWRGVPWNVEA